jgi:UDP-N-acetylmuramate dehydrogenase
MKKKFLNASQLSNSNCLGNDYQVIHINTLNELESIPVDAFVIGKGTNTLFYNSQKNQIITLKELNKVEISANTVNAQAGITLPQLIHKLKNHNLGGLEFTFPIPASLGGAIYQNFSSFGLSISDFIIEVTCYDKINKKFLVLSNNECKFCYRHSIFQNNNYIITSAKLLLEDININEINERCQNIYNKRINIYPINKTLGSIFKNPPNFSAGQIIDNCELKGYVHKTINISKNHANIFLFNQNSLPEDALDLINIIKDKVHAKFNIELVEEISIY